MTPDPLSGCPYPLGKSWRWNISFLYRESSQCNGTDRLVNNTPHTPNHESHIVMARSAEPICGRDSTKRCSAEAQRGPILGAGMPERWNDKAQSIWDNRLLDND